MPGKTLGLTKQSEQYTGLPIGGDWGAPDFGVEEDMERILSLSFLNPNIQNCFDQIGMKTYSEFENPFHTLFVEDSLLETNDWKEFILDWERKFISGECVNQDDFQLFDNDNGEYIIEEYCNFFYHQLGKGEFTIDSEQVSFIFYILSGLHKDYLDIFVENKLLNTKKIKNLFELLLCEYREGNGKVLKRIISLSNVLNTFCHHCQFDIEKRQQISEICDIISHYTSEIVLKKEYEEHNKNHKEELQKIHYVYSRNIVNHSYMKPIHKRDNTLKWLQEYHTRISQNITSARAILLGGGKNWLIPVVIGNMSCLIGTLCLELENKQLTKYEQAEFESLIREFYTFFWVVFDTNPEIQQDFKEYIHQHELSVVLKQCNKLFKLSYALLEQTHLPPKNYYLQTDLEFIQYLFNDQKPSITNYETIHHVLMFSDTCSGDDLSIFLNNILSKENNIINLSVILLKNIDIILRKLHQFGELEKNHLDNVSKYIGQFGKNSHLLIAYSRLHLTLSYLYADFGDEKNATRYLYKFAKINGIENLSNALQRYGLCEIDFVNSIFVITKKQYDLGPIKEDYKSILEKHLREYELEYYSEIINNYLFYLTHLGDKNQTNINIILDFIKHHVFHGICDIYEGETELCQEKNMEIYNLEETSGKVIFRFKFRKSFSELFHRLLRHSKAYLPIMEKTAREQLRLSSKEQINLEVLNNAMQEGRMFGYYQPIANQKGQIEYFEMLMRIELEDTVIKDPTPYIDVARKKGIIPDITIALITQVIRDIKTYPNLKASINMDVNDLLDETFYSAIGVLFEQYPKLHNYISFEILESAWQGERKDEIFSRLIKLSTKYHIKFALDDFGTGEANIVMLHKLIKKGIVSTVKIDQELVQALFSESAREQSATQHLLDGIIGAANIYDCKVVFEHVREESQGYFIVSKFPGVLLQGWGFSGRDTKIPVFISEYEKNKK